MLLSASKDFEIVRVRKFSFKAHKIIQQIKNKEFSIQNYFFLQSIFYRKVKKFGVPVVIGGDNLPYLVIIGLTHLPNICPCTHPGSGISVWIHPEISTINTFQIIKIHKGPKYFTHLTFPEFLDLMIIWNNKLTFFLCSNSVKWSI